MLTFVFGTDPHFSDLPPISRTDDWTATLFDKFGQVQKVVNKLKVDAVLLGGDVFHVKSPSRNSHELVRKVSDHFKSYSCPVYCVPGNHDCVYGDYNRIGQQPLGVLYSTGVFQRLYDEHEVTFERDGVTVRVVGVPFHGTTYDMERFRRIRKGSETYLIVVAHLLASPKGGSMFEGESIIKYNDLLEYDADCFCFGHWHKDQDITVLGGKTIVNVGSMTRGSLSQDDLTRNPAIALLQCDASGLKATKVKLKVKPAEEVFNLERRREEIRRADIMSTFVDTIKKNLENATSDVSVVDTVKSLSSVSEQVRERALLLLERVQ